MCVFGNATNHGEVHPSRHVAIYDESPNAPSVNTDLSHSFQCGELERPLRHLLTH